MFRVFRSSTRKDKCIGSQKTSPSIRDMFSIDDDLDDLDEDDFLRVALKFETGTTSREPPAKRRSFELGGIPSKENRPGNVSLATTSCLSSLTSTGNTSSSAGIGFMKTAIPTGTAGMAQTKHFPTQHTQTSTASLQVPVRSCALVTKTTVSTGSTVSKQLKCLTPKDLGGEKVTSLPFLGENQEDLMDLDLSLDEPLIWKPSVPDHVGGLSRQNRPGQSVVSQTNAAQSDKAGACNGNVVKGLSTLRTSSHLSAIRVEKNDKNGSSNINDVRNSSKTIIGSIAGSSRQSLVKPTPVTGTLALHGASFTGKQSDSITSETKPPNTGLNSRDGIITNLHTKRLDHSRLDLPTNASSSTGIPKVRGNLSKVLDCGKKGISPNGQNIAENRNSAFPEESEPEYSFDLGLDFGSDDDFSLADSDVTRSEAEIPIPGGLSNRLSVASRTPQGAQRTVNPQETDATPSEKNKAGVASREGHGSKRKRKFPGPAGLLPKLFPGMKMEEAKLPTPNSPQVAPPTTQAEPVSSQSGEDVFMDRPWLTMKQELEPQAQSIVKAFTIASLIKKASRKQLPRGKVPVVCVVLEQLDVQSTDGSAVLRDPTGQMKGTIHRQLLRDHPTELCPGTALVLRQVGVFSPSSRSHYLNITPSNVVRLYHRDQDGVVQTTSLSRFITADFKPTTPPPRPQLDITQDIGRQGGVALKPLAPARGQHGRSPVTPSGGLWGGPRGPRPPGGGQTTPTRFVSRPPYNQSVPRAGNYTNHQSNPSLRPNPALNRPVIGQGGQYGTSGAQSQTLQPNSRSGPNQNLNSPRLQPSSGPNISAGQKAVSGFSFRKPVTGVNAGGMAVHGNRTPEGAGRSGVKTPGGATEPVKLAAQGLSTEDLWEDDQLDNLLTGLDDEMLVEF